MAHPRRRSGFVASKRQTTWVGPADQGYVAVASGAKVLVASFDPDSSSLKKTTLIRTRGMMSVRPATLSTGIDLIGAWGLAVVSDQAFGIGITAIPGPFTNAGWDGWFAWGSYSFSWDDATSVGRAIASIQFEVDSKGMRKVSDNETVVVVAEQQGGGATVSMPFRLLFKLS